MGFWLFAAILAAFVAALLLLVLLRGRAGDAPAAAYDLKVYRDQLREVEKDLARGVVTEDDAERVRLEVSRRVLEADRALQAGTDGARAPKPLTWAVGGLCAALVLGGSLALYQRIGAPGYPDLPLQARKDAADTARQNRPRQTQAEAMLPPSPDLDAPDPRHQELVEQLRAVVEQRPDDTEGLILLARNEAALGNFKAAYVAQSRMIGLKQDQATAEDFAILAEMMILAAGGYISPEAEAALEQALNRDQTNGSARFYLGLLYAQTGRPDIAFRVWRALLNDSAPDAPWIAPIRDGIEELAWRAGVDYTLPPAAGTPALRGPSDEDMQAAADMTPEERTQMIRGMVEGLNDRLANEGGTAAEWAQLINALGMLGEADRAAAIWAEAQQVFGQRPDQLAQIRAAAENAGVAE
ncbi:c-type cytochrome biogenesis protein CcmI [Actibacterium sp. D379-3]